MVRVSYLQIYNENVYDLLCKEKASLTIREDKRRGVYVEHLSEWAVRQPSEIYALMKRGALARITASHRLNDVSSRSHAVFMVVVEQLSGVGAPGEGQISTAAQQLRVAKLNLVDLAGSERIKVTGATGQRLEESKKINQSLSALGNVIAQLTEGTG